MTTTGGSIKAVLAVVVVATVVVAASSYINNAALKDGISIRKCDFPFPRPPSIGGPPGGLCNGRVFCVDDAEGPNNPWYILQSRSSRSRAFNKNYSAYEQGFGESLVDDYWLGLMCLQMMTASGDNELLVRMVDREGDVGTAVYSSFSVGFPSAKYQLRVEEFDEERSDAGDSMSQSNGMRFTALDQDNDEEDGRNCARKFLGGWWYQDCNFNSINNFLNGYFSRGHGHRDRGVQWETWETESAVVSTFILFRPRVNRVLCGESTSKGPIYTCPNGTAKFENSFCFLVADSSFAGIYDRAVSFCNSIGMRVASIHSPEEQAFVARQLNGSVWIDLKDEVNEGVFVWGDGTPFNYASFGAGEPSDTKHKENCIAMNSGIGYKWVDQSCSDRNQFLCMTAAVVS